MRTVATLFISFFCAGAAIANPCSMRVTDMDLGAYSGDEKHLLGEIWLHCDPFTAFYIDIIPPLSQTSPAPYGSQKREIAYKIIVNEQVAGVRVEEHHDLMRLYGRTGEETEMSIPFTLVAQGGQRVTAGQHLSSFRIELHAY